MRIADEMLPQLHKPLVEIDDKRMMMMATTMLMHCSLPLLQPLLEHDIHSKLVRSSSEGHTERNLYL
jgi:hypothetical protein